MTTAAAHEGLDTKVHHGEFFVNIESVEYPWDRPTITVLEIRLIGRLPENQGCWKSTWKTTPNGP